MTPSEKITRRVKRFAEQWEGTSGLAPLLQEGILGIVEEAVREAILVTSKVMGPTIVDSVDEKLANPVGWPPDA